MKESFVLFFQSVGSLIKIALMSGFRNILKSETSKNKSCIILGNGPSLTRSIEKHSFEQQDILCVNNFVSSHFYTEIKPRFYILGAPILFFEEGNMSPFYIQLRNTIFNGLSEKTTWRVELMVPKMARKSAYFTSFLVKNPLITPLYYNTTPVEGLSGINHFLFSRGLGMPRPHNVLVPAIMNCIHLGYKEIYLFGADHSWLGEIEVNDKNEALVNQKHFYDENESKPEKMQDFISRPRRLHEIIHKFYLSFKGYWEIKFYAEKRGVSIVNCSETSMIDAFERGTFQTPINQNNEKQ
jgi:hypothetical protein